MGKPFVPSRRRFCKITGASLIFLSLPVGGTEDDSSKPSQTPLELYFNFFDTLKQNAIDFYTLRKRSNKLVSYSELEDFKQHIDDVIALVDKATALAQARSRSRIEESAQYVSVYKEMLRTLQGINGIHGGLYMSPTIRYGLETRDKIKIGDLEAYVYGLFMEDGEKLRSISNKGSYEIIQFTYYGTIQHIPQGLGLRTRDRHNPVTVDTRKEGGVWFSDIFSKNPNKDFAKDRVEQQYRGKKLSELQQDYFEFYKRFSRAVDPNSSRINIEKLRGHICDIAGKATLGKEDLTEPGGGGGTLNQDSDFHILLKEVYRVLEGIEHLHNGMNLGPWIANKLDQADEFDLDVGDKRAHISNMGYNQKNERVIKIQLFEYDATKNTMDTKFIIDKGNVAFPDLRNVFYRDIFR